MLSHRDSDHTGGAAAVLAMQPQAALLSSIEDGHELQALRPVAALRGRPALGVGRRAISRCCIPRPATTQAATKPNAMSCVLRVANGAHTRPAGRRHRAGAGGAAGRAQGAAAAGRRAAGAPPRQQDLVQRRLPGRGAARAGRWCRRATATASAIRRRRWWSAMRERGIRVVDSPRCGAARLVDRRSRGRCLRARRQRAPLLAPSRSRELSHGGSRSALAAGPEIAILCARRFASCTNSTRCTPSCRRATASSSFKASLRVGKARSRSRVSATTTRAMRNGWRASRAT